MTDLDELIAEARAHHFEMSGLNTRGAEVLAELADALEAAGAERDAEVAAKALNDAADDVMAEHNDVGDWWDDMNSVYVKPSGWLRARAAEYRKAVQDGRSIEP